MKKNIKKIEKPTMVGVGSTAWFGNSVEEILTPTGFERITEAFQVLLGKRMVLHPSPQSPDELLESLCHPFHSHGRKHKMWGLNNCSYIYYKLQDFVLHLRQEKKQRAEEHHHRDSQIYKGDS